MKRKACPLLVQSNTEPSITMRDASYTRTFFLECLGERCAAFVQDEFGAFCKKFQSNVIIRANEEADE